MRKLTLFLCFAAAVLMAGAQKEKAAAYIEAHKEIAITEMMRTGVPASIKLAQGILESQSGESDLAKNSHNHFGIKCKTEWTGEKVYHDDDTRGECFRVYNSDAESYRDHSDFLKSRPNYASLFELDPTDYEGWAKGLKKAGYATSATYPQRLLKIIDDYDLQQYSLMAIARLKNGDRTGDAKIAIAAVTADQQQAAQTTVVNQQSIAAVIADIKEDAGIAAPLNTEVAVKKEKSNYPEGVFAINSTKVIYALEGTSLLSLANQYDINLSKLMEFNELTEMDILDTDRLIFIERKQKKGSIDFHVVAATETLHDICQKEGVRMDYLLEYNKLKKDTRLSAGEKLYLRPVSTSVAKTKASR